MDSIKKTLDDLTEHFNMKMSEFQKELKSSIPATSPTSNINAQFNAFRSFVLAALENLQLQVELLSRQSDDMEMRSRKKILLVHGVPEAKNENITENLVKLLSERLQLPELTSDSIRTSRRLGRSSPERPRAILVKFKETSLRDKVWFSKKCLKGSGVTLSEFLTKRRHEAFLTARQRFGINKCWTRDGVVVVVGSDGSKHRIFSLADLNAVPSSNNDTEVPSTASAIVQASKDNKLSQLRTRRNVKK
ncbi:uncharacterized protein LOC124542812 [Vanessa cardui]|uniref:uncharacterized protein LOC124542812 n=1 Tax=Vanessa cardui TaxID=171605 RepID=UPI001F14392A|nr:uncharacterized protein LOC124542812 [Vanessa cardui]